MSDNDALLLRRFAETGDAEAFAAIVRQYAGFVFGTCRRVLGNESAASDAAQETFFYLLRNASRVTGSLGGWLHRVAVNRSRDLLRADVARRKREAAYSAETWRETDQWEDVSPAVDEGLESLPPEERELLMRHFLQGQSMVEMAAMDGVSQPTVSRRVADALERLRAELRLSAGQRDAVNTIVERVRAFEDRMRSEIGQTPIQSRGQAMGWKFAEAEQEVARAREEIVRLLAPAQAKRLEEISLQDSGATALFQPDVIQTLGISPEQQQRLAEIQDKAGEEIAALHGVARNGTVNPRRSGAAAQTATEIVQGSERRMLGEVLTAQQQARFRELKGPPFEFPHSYRPAMSLTGGGAGGGSLGGRIR